MQIFVVGTDQILSESIMIVLGESVRLVLLANLTTRNGSTDVVSVRCVLRVGDDQQTGVDSSYEEGTTRGTRS